MESFRKIIREDKIWHSRARNIEIVHAQLILKNKSWSIRRTAKLLGMCPSIICEDLQLARYLIEDPSIERFKFRKDALRFIRE